MPVFEFTASNGKTYEVEGANRQGAIMAFKNHIANTSPAPAPPQAPPLNPATNMPDGFFVDPRKTYTDPKTGKQIQGVTSRARLAEEQGGQGNLTSGLIGAGQGSSFGFSDEAFGGLNKLLGPLMGQRGTPEQLGQFGTEYARAGLDAARDENPMAAFSGELAGGLAVPAGGVQRAKTGLGAVLKGAGYGTGMGALYGYGSGENGFENRLKQAEKGAVVGGIFGAATTPVANIAKKIGNKTYNALFNKSIEAPSLENLYRAKQQAYKMADQSGEIISPDAIDSMVMDALGVMDKAGFVRGSKTPNARALNEALSTISNMTKEGFDGERIFKGRLSDMEEVRKNLNASLKSGNFDPRIKDIINKFDALIENSTSEGSDVLNNARSAFKRYKKVEILDQAVAKAELETQVTGSGGNINNKLRSALKNIISSKNASFYSENELEVMRRVAAGDIDSNILRLVGKLSPGGNGLMTFLNLAAVSTEPAMFSATIAGALSKRAADKNQRQLTDDVRQYLATGSAPIRDKSALGGTGGVAALNQEEDNPNAQN